MNIDNELLALVLALVEKEVNNRIKTFYNSKKDHSDLIMGLRGERGLAGVSIKGDKGEPGLSIKGDKGEPGIPGRPGKTPSIEPLRAELLELFKNQSDEADIEFTEWKKKLEKDFCDLRDKLIAFIGKTNYDKVRYGNTGNSGLAASGSGGANLLRELLDIDFGNLEDGYILSWNETNNKFEWIPNAGNLILFPDNNTMAFYDINLRREGQIGYDGDSYYKMNENLEWVPINIGTNITNINIDGSTDPDEKLYITGRALTNSTGYITLDLRDLSLSGVKSSLFTTYYDEQYDIEKLLTVNIIEENKDNVIVYVTRSNLGVFRPGATLEHCTKHAPMNTYVNFLIVGSKAV